MSYPVDIVLLFLLGLVIGSFLNVCIYRLPRGESIVVPRSHCPSCKVFLCWFDNVPLLGYLILRGHCRECKSVISPVYPLVELSTAILLVAQYAVIAHSPVLVLVRLFFSCLMIVLFFTDLQHRVLPNMVTIPGVIIGWCCSWFVSPGWLDSSISIVVGSTFLIVLSETYYRIVGREGLGMGDVKMLAMIGAFLGWELMLFTMLMASILGVLVWIAILVSGRGGTRYLLPLGSFMAISATAMSVSGSLIMPWWYMTILSWAPSLF